MATEKTVSPIGRHIFFKLDYIVELLGKHSLQTTTGFFI
jgi:hypothetical protein